MLQTFQKRLQGAAKGAGCTPQRRSFAMICDCGVVRFCQPLRCQCYCVRMRCRQTGSIEAVIQEGHAKDRRTNLLHGFLHEASLAAALLNPLVTNEVPKGIGVNQQGSQLAQKPRSLTPSGAQLAMAPRHELHTPGIRGHETGED
eukprot:Skav220278  [mRNA]  locus=scaffold915:27162:28200:- [translate_table: standard]